MDNSLSTVVIPALEPHANLIEYVKVLCASGFNTVIVDDGSGPAYKDIFSALSHLEGCVVLRHETNLGKGTALKTAYRYLLDTEADVHFVITADSDGQHTREDVARLAQALQEDPDGVILGNRDFSLSQVPFKSRAGNRITSFVFALLFGARCPDTQTGLRAFSRTLLPFMAEVAGERFEYEMNVLIALTRAGIRIRHIPIRTLYEDGNAGTHFQTVRDSVRIYKTIFASFFAFLSSSLIATGMDMAIYYILFDVLETAGWNPAWQRIALAKTVARVSSASFNFLVNKRFVFKLKSGGVRAAVRYAALCVMVLLMSVGAVSLLNRALSINERILSPIVDLILFFINYRVQAGWVFKKEERT